MKKNLISVISVLVLLVSFSTALAMGGPNSQYGSGGKTSGGNQTQTQAMPANQTQRQLQTNAQQPESGLKNQTCQGGQAADKNCGLEALATYLEIDTTDMTAEEVAAAIKTAVEALDSTALAALADEMNIDTTDMTDAEILAAVEAMLTPPTSLR